MTRTISLTLPDAWITEDGALFMVANPYLPITRAFEAGNKALEENSYDDRITWTPTDGQASLPRMENRWVDPAYVAAEQWPDSAISEVPVDGWVKLHRIYVEDLESHEVPMAGVKP